MILNGCKMSSGYVLLNSSGCHPVPRRYISSSIPCLPTKPALLSIRNSWGPHQHFNALISKGKSKLQFSASPTPFLSGDVGGLSSLPRRHGSSSVPRAAPDLKKGYRYPPMTKKPRFWWRILACFPYIMPLHETWMYAETAYHLHPFFEIFEFWCQPFLRALGGLPSWFLIAYFLVGYLGIVRRKEWPHFLRFHLVQGMLLEIFLQLVGTTSRWLPQGLYWGKFGMHFWTAFAFAFLFTVLECIRCALCGMYADVPFASDAAYMQMPYD